MTHLKPKQHYIDLYDRFTVEECRRWEKGFSKSPHTKNKNWNQVALNVSLYCIKGERFAKKDKTIKEWIASDKETDELIESAKPPKHIYCLTCGNIMTPTSRDLHSEIDKKDRVLFMYDCPNNCLPKRAFLNNGEEWKPKPHICPVCNITLEVVDKRIKNKIVTYETCGKCKYHNKDVLDLTIKKPEVDNQYQADRLKYCLSDEEGQEYIDQKFKLKAFNDLLEEKKHQKKQKKVKQLNIAQLTKLLSTKLEKENYLKFDISKPEIDRFLIVKFTVQDLKSDRVEYDSKNNLRKQITKLLENTNWHLMQDSLCYKLGVISGRLKGD